MDYNRPYSGQTEVMTVIDLPRDPRKLLAKAFAEGRLLLAGIDPPADLRSLPPDIVVGSGDNLSVQETLVRFAEGMIDAVADIAVGIKPNIGFFERHRQQGGLNALERIVSYCHAAHPHLLVILDTKRNDIGKSAEAQADGVFSYGADGTTVNGYLGVDGIMPFVNYDGGSKLVFPLIRTSNPSAAML